jgi:outer membrane protein assembly factor BamB
MLPNVPAHGVADAAKKPSLVNLGQAQRDARTADKAEKACYSFGRTPGAHAIEGGKMGLRLAVGSCVGIGLAVVVSCGGREASRTTCGPGTQLDAVAQCVPVAAVICGPGTFESAGTCLPIPASGGATVTCGPGTALFDGECYPNSSKDGGEAPGDGSDAVSGDDASRMDAGTVDAGTADEGIVLLDAGAEAGGGLSQATSFAIDPAHDNAQPNDTVASPLRSSWTANLSGAASYPLVVGSQVIVAAAGSQANVRSLDLLTGSVVWGPVVFGGTVWIAYDGGKVFGLEGDGNLTALDGTDGHLIWATALEGEYEFPSPPVAANGLVYVNGLGEGGLTYAVDELTGGTVWTAGTFDGSDGTIAVAGGVVYEAEACDQLSAFDAQTGHLGWYHDGNCTGGGGAAPSVYEGYVWERDWASGDVIFSLAGMTAGSFSAQYVPSFFGGTALYVDSESLSAIDVQSRVLKWSFAGDNQICTSAVIAGAGGQVFVGSQSGNVYEIDAATGNQVSVSNAGNPVTCGSETQSMAIAAGHLFVPAGNTLVAY